MNSPGAYRNDVSGLDSGNFEAEFQVDSLTFGIHPVRIKIGQCRLITAPLDRLSGLLVDQTA